MSRPDIKTDQHSRAVEAAELLGQLAARKVASITIGQRLHTSVNVITRWRNRQPGRTATVEQIGQLRAMLAEAEGSHVGG